MNGQDFPWRSDHSSPKEAVSAALPFLSGLELGPHWPALPKLFFLPPERQETSFYLCSVETLARLHHLISDISDETQGAKYLIELFH